MICADRAPLLAQMHLVASFLACDLKGEAKGGEDCHLLLFSVFGGRKTGN